LNKMANIVVAAVISLGVLGTWPKDADDILFGIFQLAGLLAIVASCLRWHDESPGHEPEGPVSPRSDRRWGH
jgi:hypothetical protein